MSASTRQKTREKKGGEHRRGGGSKNRGARARRTGGEGRGQWKGWRLSLASIEPDRTNGACRRKKDTKDVQPADTAAGTNPSMPSCDAGFVTIRGWHTACATRAPTHPGDGHGCGRAKVLFLGPSVDALAYWMAVFSHQFDEYRGMVDVMCASAVQDGITSRRGVERLLADSHADIVVSAGNAPLKTFTDCFACASREGRRIPEGTSAEMHGRPFQIDAHAHQRVTVLPFLPLPAVCDWFPGRRSEPPRAGTGADYLADMAVGFGVLKVLVSCTLGLCTPAEDGTAF